MDLAHVVPIFAFISLAATSTLAVIWFAKRSGHKHSAKIADLVHDALTAKQSGNVKSAEPLFERAVAVLRDESTPHFGMYTSSVIHLAQCYSQRGELEDANKLYAEVLELWKSALESPVPKDLTDIDYAGATYEFGWSTNDVANLFRQVVDAKRTIYGPIHQEVVNSLTIQIRLLKLMGRLEEAEMLDIELQSVLNALQR